MTRQKILDDIAAERERQIEKWTGTFDDAQWNCADWHEMIADYNAWARRMGAMGSEDKRRRRLIQVAALAVAAVEVIDAKQSEEVDKYPLCLGGACSLMFSDGCGFERPVQHQNPVSYSIHCFRPEGPKTPEFTDEETT